MKRRTKIFRAAIVVLVIIVLALICARIYLPYWLKDHVNEKLAAIPGYSGKVDEIGVSLYRGAYQIHNLKIISDKPNIPVPFVDIKRTDLSIQWKELFKGRIVSEIYLDNPNLNFAVSKDGRNMQTGQSVDWTKPIQELMPIDINHVEVNNGAITYKDYSATQKVDLFIKNLNGRLDNLRNTTDNNVALPSSLSFNGGSIGGGKFAIDGKLNILRPTPDMDMDWKIESVNLPALNNYFNELAGIDFNKGVLNIYSEFIVKNHHLTGYIKPLATDIDMVSLEQDGNNPLDLIWESMASVVLEIFTNQPNDQFATKAVIEGQLDSPNTPFWPTFFGIVRNAFVEAFTKGTDKELSFSKAKKP